MTHFTSIHTLQVSVKKNFVYVQFLTADVKNSYIEEITNMLDWHRFSSLTPEEESNGYSQSPNLQLLTDFVRTDGKNLLKIIKDNISESSLIKLQRITSFFNSKIPHFSSFIQTVKARDSLSNLKRLSDQAASISRKAESDRLDKALLSLKTFRISLVSSTAGAFVKPGRTYSDVVSINIVPPPLREEPDVTRSIWAKIHKHTLGGYTDSRTPVAKALEQRADVDSMFDRLRHSGLRERHILYKPRKHNPVPSEIVGLLRIKILQAIAYYTSLAPTKRDKCELIVNNNYDSLCYKGRDRVNDKAVRDDRACRSTVFIIVKNHKLSVPRGARLLDFMPMGGYISFSSQVFTSPLELHDFLQNAFVNQNDRRWSAAFCAIMTPLVINPDEYQSVLHCLRKAHNRIHLANGASVFAHDGVTSHYTFISDRALAVAHGCEWVLEPTYNLSVLENIIRNKIISILCEYRKLQSGPATPFSVSTTRVQDFSVDEFLNDGDYVPTHTIPITKDESYSAYVKRTKNNTTSSDYTSYLKSRDTFFSAVGDVNAWSSDDFMGLSGLCNNSDYVEYVPAVTRVIAFMVAINSVSTLKGVLAVSVLGCPELVKYLVFGEKYMNGKMSRVERELNEAWSRRSRFQGSSDATIERSFVDKFKDSIFSTPVNTFLGTELGSAFWDLLASFSVINVFAATGMVGSPTVVRRWIKEFSSFLKDDGSRKPSLESFAEAIFRFLNLMITRISVAFKAGDWTLFFRDELTIDKWSLWIETLIENEAVRFDPARPSMDRLFRAEKSAGMLPTQIVTPLTPEMRADQLRSALALESELRVRYSDNHAANVVLKVMAGRARNEERAIMGNKSNASYRMVPFAIFLHGVPGVGKTTLVAKIHRVFGEYLGYCGDETTMYRIDPNSNFHDGYHDGQWAANLDDIDQSLAPESAGFVNHAQLVNRIVNSVPYCYEAADVENKGKNYCNPMVVYYSTNFPMGNLRGRTDEPGQFWRRFNLRISMTIKPEYDNGSGGIHRVTAYDPSTGEIKKNIWKYEVRLYNGISPNHAERFESLPFGDAHVFLDDATLMGSLCHLFGQHRAKELKVIEKRVEAPHHLTKCPYCFCDETLHDNLNGSVQWCGGVRKLQSAQNSPMVSLINWMVCIAGCWMLMKYATKLFDKICNEWHKLDGVVRDLIGMVFIQFLHSRISSYALIGYYSPKLIRHNLLRMVDSSFMRATSAAMRKNTRAIKMGAVCATACGLITLILAKIRKVRQLQGAGPPLLTGLSSRNPGVWSKLSTTLFERNYSDRVKPTYTKAEMISVLQKRMFIIKGRSSVYGFQLGHGRVVFPKHALLNDTTDPRLSTLSDCDLRVVVWVNDAPIEVILDSCQTFAIVGRDVIVSFIPELPKFKDKWALDTEFPPTCLAGSASSADEACLVRPLTISSAGKLQTHYKYTDSVGAPCFAVPYSNTVDGECGMPLVATFGDRFYIVGFHCIRAELTFPQRTAFTISESLNMADLGPSLAFIKKSNPNSLDIVLDPRTVSPSQDALSFQGLREFSSLNIALQNKQLPFIVFGEYVGPTRFGASLSTRIHPTGFVDRELDSLVKLEFEHSDGFAPPIFKGRMVGVGDGRRWVDPHTRATESFLNKGGDANLWRMSVADYLTGVESLPGLTGKVPLSDYSTIVGIDATTCGSFNLKTSAGPPFYRNKNSCVIVDRSVSPPVVSLHKDLIEGINRIMQIVDEGDVYSPIAVHCLKDETVTVKKNEACKIRVFNIMPFAFNFLLKKYIAPIIDLFREHNIFFEHAIGINIASMRDSKLLYAHLTHFQNCSASDVSDFDVTASTRELYHSCLVVQKLSFYLGYTALERKRLWGLLMSSMHVTHVNKGDFWLTNFGLASGYWVTLFLNCIRNSLQSRYAYFAHGTEKIGSFRFYVRLMVLGDDNISAVDDAIRWYDQIYVAECLKHIGAKRTSSRKGTDLVPFESFSEATFLKRVFVVWEDGLIVCPIEKKTLYRMLSFKRRTELSNVDHQAVILSTVMAEAWMWGRAFFNVMCGIVGRLADQHCLICNTNYVVYSFDAYVDRYKNDKLVVWDPLCGDDVITEFF